MSFILIYLLQDIECTLCYNNDTSRIHTFPIPIYLKISYENALTTTFVQTMREINTFTILVKSQKLFISSNTIFLGSICFIPIEFGTRIFYRLYN